MEKVCFKCGELKPLSEFYKHKSMKDGHLNKCKSCTKGDAHKHRVENIEKIQAYDRNRPNKGIRYQKIKEYRSTERGKDVARRANQKYNQDILIKTAHTKLGNAVKYGLLEKPSNCESCGVNCKPHGHHDDYRKPLSVRWLCTDCHVLFHNTVREKKRELVKIGMGDLFSDHALIKHVASYYWN